MHVDSNVINVRLQKKVSHPHHLPSKAVIEVEGLMLIWLLLGNVVGMAMIEEMIEVVVPVESIGHQGMVEMSTRGMIIKEMTEGMIEGMIDIVLTKEFGFEYIFNNYNFILVRSQLLRAMHWFHDR